MSSSTSEPAQILIVLSKKGFVDVATVLRKLAQTTASVRRGRFTEEAKIETLEMLRSTYENQRKAYMFSLINASEGLHTAAAVIETGPTDLLSRKESKKLAQLKLRKFQFRKNSVDKAQLLCFLCNKVYCCFVN